VLPGSESVPDQDGTLITPSAAIVFLGIDDAEHFSPEQRAELLTRYPEHERLARLYGIPQLGSGAVFPYPEEDILCDDIPIPAHWAEIGGLDFGWDHPTAAVKLAWDRDADRVYVTKDYARSKAEPLLHAAALKAWGADLPWAWPADGIGADGKGGGEPLRMQYQKHGLKLLSEHAQTADGSVAVEAGIMEMADRMLTGRWKVFRSCMIWRAEYRTYHRDKGKIVKLYDDAISASRYASVMLRFARAKGPAPDRYARHRSGAGGRSQATY
jgi:hypothetical protein